MDVDETKSLSHELPSIDEEEDLLIRRLVDRGKSTEQINDFRPVPKVTAREFADYERMGKDLLVVEKDDEAAVGFSKMVDPHGSVDQNHQKGLRRRGAFAEKSDPPSAAKRLALRRATRASSPMRTSAVFSATPVSSAAFLRMVSSMFSVVLMHMMMHKADVFVNPGPTPPLTLREPRPRGTR
jgi:hypothetical protein